MEHGRYETEPIYGDGTAGKQIAEILANRELSIRKRMTY